jgi:hypothetical protein
MGKDWGGKERVESGRLPMASERQRGKTGEISRKHGNTLIRTLRKHYGANFAPGCDDDEKLSAVLHELDEPSLSKLVLDHENKTLGQICGDAA